MKLKPMICPQCHANISFKPDQKVGFCSFCGTQIVLDDEVKTVHITKDVHIKKDVTYTHRTIDEARLKEAEVAEKREERKAKRMERKQHSKAKRRIVFLGIIVMAIAYAKIKGNIKDAKRVEFGKTLNQICTDHDANVSYLRDNSEYMSVDIKVDTYEKSDIDAFQQDLVDKLVIPKGSEFDVDFESKDGDLIRSIEITDSGVVTINKDNRRL